MVFEENFKDLNKKITEKEKINLEGANEIWIVGDESEWFPNPGGIPGNVLSRLPRFLKIPAEAAASDIDDKRGVLGKTLSELFEEVRNVSPHYKEAQTLLNKLAKELDLVCFFRIHALGSPLSCRNFSIWYFSWYLLIILSRSWLKHEAFERY